MITKPTSLRQKLSTFVGAAALTMACVPALANHIPSTGISFGKAFTITPSAIGATGCGGGSCTANYIDFSYQAEVDQQNTGPASANFTETAAGVFGTFRTALGGFPVANTGLGTNYQMYFVLDSAGSIAPNSTVGIKGTMSSLHYTIYVDVANNTIAPPVGSSTYNFAGFGNTGDDVAVLTGDLVPGEGGFHIFDGLAAGDFDVLATATRLNGFFGGVAFTNPLGSYIDINGVNTTITGLNTLATPFSTANDIGIIGSGNVSFAPVPEPASLSLLGLGVAGVAFFRRKKAIAKLAK